MGHVTPQLKGRTQSGRRGTATQPVLNHGCPLPAMGYGDLVVVAIGVWEPQRSIWAVDGLPWTRWQSRGANAQAPTVALFSWVSDGRSPAQGVFQSGVKAWGHYRAWVFAAGTFDPAPVPLVWAMNQGVEDRARPDNPHYSQGFPAYDNAEYPYGYGACAVFLRGGTGLGAWPSEWSADSSYQDPANSTWEDLAMAAGSARLPMGPVAFTAAPLPLDKVKPWGTVAFVVQPLTSPRVMAVGWSQAGEQVTLLPQTIEYPTSWEWTFGDSSPNQTVGPDGRVTHPYLGGDYLVSVTPSNAAGPGVGWSGWVHVLPEPPQARFSYSHVPGLLALDLQDLSLRVGTRSWTIRDSTGQVVATSALDSWRWTAAAPGTYELSLTITNAGGADTAISRVTLDAAWVAHPILGGWAVAAVTITDPSGAREVTCEVVSASWSWGALKADGLMTYPEAGRLTLRLLDPQRVLVDGVTPIAGDNLTLVLGVVGSPDVTWHGRVRDASHESGITIVSGYDTVAQLANTRVDPGGPQARPAEGLAARVHAILDIVDWPTALRDVDPAMTRQQHDQQLEGVVGWVKLLDLMRQELGQLWPDPDGTLHVRGRGAWGGPGQPVVIFDCTAPPTGAQPIPSAFDRPQADAYSSAFGPWTAVVPVPQPSDEADIRGLRVGQDLDSLVNDLTVESRDPAYVTRLQDQASIARYGRWSTNQPVDAFTAAGEVDAFGQAVLVHHKDPAWTMTLEPLVNEHSLELLLSLRMYSWVQVRDNGLDMLMRVTGAEWSLGPADLTVKLQLARTWGGA